MRHLPRRLPILRSRLFCWFAWLIFRLAILIGPLAGQQQPDGRRAEGGRSVPDQILHGVLQGLPADQVHALRRAEFLHVQAKQRVKGIFVDLPESAQRQRKAEGEDRRKAPAQRYGDLAGTVQHVHDGDAQQAQHDGGKAVQKRIPEGHQIIEVEDLAQVNGAVEEHVVLDIQNVRHRQLPAAGRPGGQQHDRQTQNALGQHEQIVAAGLAFYACRERLRRAARRMAE